MTTNRAHILGLAANQQACVICDMKPQAFRETTVKTIVECSRCGLPSAINPDAPHGQQIPRPLAAVTWIHVFRRYWEEMHEKLTTPEIVGPDIELAGRMSRLNDWLNKNADFVQRSTVGSLAPYTSISAIVVRVANDRGEEVGVEWMLLLPNEAVGAAIKLPFSPEGLAVGTLLTIQTPIILPGKPS